MAWLLLKSGPRTGERIEVVGELVIGREQADVMIDDESISRRHVAIRPRDGGLEIEDLGSKNGTWLDDSRLEGATVVTTPGTRVQVGDTVIELELDRETATRVRATHVREAPEDPESDEEPAGVPVRPFGTSSASAARRRRSAATRLPIATMLTFASVAGTAGGLIAYFAAR
jgi:pSer/pThr/pTyr-binding forkhead associated (FHA) protein